jgi:hypothetical protein
MFVVFNSVFWVLCRPLWCSEVFLAIAVVFDWLVVFDEILSALLFCDEVRPALVFCGEIRSNLVCWWLVIEIRPALVLCGGFRPVVFWRDSTGLGVLWCDPIGLGVLW